MITMWLFRTLLVGVLRGVAALAAERVTGWFGGPRRWVWVSAMLGSIGIPVLALRAPAALPELGIGARWAERLTSPSGSGWQPVGGTVRAVIAVPAPHVLVIAPQKATHLPEAGWRPPLRSCRPTRGRCDRDLARGAGRGRRLAVAPRPVDPGTERRSTGAGVDPDTGSVSRSLKLSGASGFASGGLRSVDGGRSLRATVAPSIPDTDRSGTRVRCSAVPKYRWSAPERPRSWIRCCSCSGIGFERADTVVLQRDPVAAISSASRMARVASGGAPSGRTCHSTEGVLLGRRYSGEEPHA
jgi:hypothetical protein